MSIEKQIAAEVSRMADLVWAAGALDAKGLWYVTRPAEHPTHFAPRIQFKAKPRRLEPAVANLERIFGGAVDRGPNLPGRRSVQWQVSGAKACSVVNELILPYLVVNQRKAQLHQELCRRIMLRARPFDERSLTAFEVLEREKLITAISGL